MDDHTRFRGNTMRQALVYITWLAATAGVLGAIFAPGIGLVHGSPFAAVGLGLIGAGMIVHTRREATPAC
jgi:hypothetical protein